MGILSLPLFPVQLDRSEILFQELMKWRNMPLSRQKWYGFNDSLLYSKNSILGILGSCKIHQREIKGAGETTQRSRVLASLAEDLGLVPSTHMVAQDHM